MCSKSAAQSLKLEFDMRGNTNIFWVCISSLGTLLFLYIFYSKPIEKSRCLLLPKTWFFECDNCPGQSLKLVRLMKVPAEAVKKGSDVWICVPTGAQNWLSEFQVECDNCPITTLQNHPWTIIAQDKKGQLFKKNTVLYMYILYMYVCIYLHTYTHIYCTYRCKRQCTKDLRIYWPNLSAGIWWQENILNYYLFDYRYRSAATGN